MRGAVQRPSFSYIDSIAFFVVPCQGKTTKKPIIFRISPLFFKFFYFFLLFLGGKETTEPSLNRTENQNRTPYWTHDQPDRKQPDHLTKTKQPQNTQTQSEPHREPHRTKKPFTLLNLYFENAQQHQPRNRIRNLPNKHPLSTLFCWYRSTNTVDTSPAPLNSKSRIRTIGTRSGQSVLTYISPLDAEVYVCARLSSWTGTGVESKSLSLFLRVGLHSLRQM